MLGLPPLGGGYAMPRKKLAAPPDADAKHKILARLRSAEGHLRSVITMVESDAYCIDVLRQTSAIQAAVARIESLLLERHLHHCVSTAIRGEDVRQRERVLGEILDVFDAGRSARLAVQHRSRESMSQPSEPEI